MLSNITATEEINGQVYMHRDTSVKYEDSQGWIAASVLYAACFGFGLPAMVLYIYTRRMKQSLSPEQQTATRLTYGFLTKGCAARLTRTLTLTRKLAQTLALSLNPNPNPNPSPKPTPNPTL